MSEKNAFDLKNILLLESQFKRSWVIDFENPEFFNNVDINLESNVHESILNVILTVEFTAGVKDEQQIASTIKMVGVFESSDVPQDILERFANINGPAIIFPFVREHLSSMSIKAGISPILLAPVNFVQHNESKQNQ